VAVRERLERALRAITRDDPAAIVRGALADAGYAQAPRRAPGPGTGEREREDAAPRAGLASLRAAFGGQAAVLAAFLAVALGVESPSCAAREGVLAGAAPLELAPERAGGLRVVATPWANVRVDGQDVDTTPFARTIPLAPGKHWVTLTHPDSPPVEREIAVLSGETVMLDVTMPAFSADDAGSPARKP
jgi:serine/threonine-protein kinase